MNNLDHITEAVCPDPDCPHTDPRRCALAPGQPIYHRGKYLVFAPTEKEPRYTVERMDRDGAARSVAHRATELECRILVDRYATPRDWS